MPGIKGSKRHRMTDMDLRHWFLVSDLVSLSFRIRELTSVVQKRFNFPENTVELYAEKVATRGLCAIAQVSNLFLASNSVGDP
jgi:hypothetical protein